MIKEYKQKHYNFVDLKKKTLTLTSSQYKKMKNHKKNSFFFFSYSEFSKAITHGYVREYLSCIYGEGIYGEQYF